MFVFVLLGITLCPFWFAIIFKRKRGALCFAVIFLHMCKCSVALPCGAVGWSAVCDWGIS